jgi:hypothetical protein
VALVTLADLRGPGDPPPPDRPTADALASAEAAVRRALAGPPPDPPDEPTAPVGADPCP